MKLGTPTELLSDQLRELHSMESQVILVLPELARKAHFPGLQQLLVEHENECLAQKDRLQRIADRNHRDSSGGHCKAMQELIMATHEGLAEAGNAQIGDLLLIAHGSRIVCYEIAAYQFALSLAERLAHLEDAVDLRMILNEEQRFVSRLAAQGASAFGLPWAIPAAAGSKVTTRVPPAGSCLTLDEV
jgi:ferritin-like metal-binding protein YciE